MIKKIYISPSTQTGNAYSYGKTNEHVQCVRIAAELEKALKRNGYTVKVASEKHTMEQNIAESNKWGADLHIPIHTNAGGGSGPLVMVYSLDNENTKYAYPVYNALRDNSPDKTGLGVRVGSTMTNGNYMPAELSETKAVAIYCECEFHDNARLAKWIIENVKSIGESICRGICKADGKAYIPESKTTVKYYRVQVGAFIKEEKANAMLDKLKKAGFKDAFIVTSKG